MFVFVFGFGFGFGFGLGLGLGLGLGFGVWSGLHVAQLRKGMRRDGGMWREAA